MNPIKKWLHKRRDAERVDAEQRGYCWAWLAYRFEHKSIMEIEAYLDLPIDQSREELAFDNGAQLALDDIRRFQAEVLYKDSPEVLRKERDHYRQKCSELAAMLKSRPGEEA